jgi:hypothetical protein
MYFCGVLIMFARGVFLVLGFGFCAAMTGAANAAVAAKTCKPDQTAMECACESALEANTLEALEDFLRRYPGDESKGSACFAQALAQWQTEADNQSNSDRGADQTGPLSGSPN